jgi:hypothetical protein
LKQPRPIAEVAAVWAYRRNEVENTQVIRAARRIREGNSEPIRWPHRGGFVSAQAKLNNIQLIHQFPSRTMLERWISFLGAYVLAF